MHVVVVTEHRFRAMGTDCHLQVLDAPPGSVDAAEAMVRADEGRWSRFLSDSEVSRLNASAGRTVEVSPETVGLVDLATTAVSRTGGWFDPLVGGDVIAAGYDRSFTDMIVSGPGPVASTTPARHGSLVSDGRTVMVPRGAALDLGGVAKGHTADRVAALLVASGAAGACVNIGGDLRCLGASPADHGWWCSLDHVSGVAVGLSAGAVATSTTTRRQWLVPVTGLRAHHLIDPRTRRPSIARSASASVIAGDAATAEVLATAAVLAPADEADEIVTAAGAAAIVTDADGAHRTIGPVDRYIGRVDRAVA